MIEHRENEHLCLICEEDRKKKISERKEAPEEAEEPEVSYAMLKGSSSALGESEVLDAKLKKSKSTAREPEALKESRENKTSNKTLERIVLAGVLFLIGAIFNSALHATPFSIAEYAVLVPAYLLVGGPVLLAAFQNIRHGKVFDEMFLMSIATIGAMIIHQLPEAVGVMLFYTVGEYLQDLAVDRSRGSIAALMDLRPEWARVFEKNKGSKEADELNKIDGLEYSGTGIRRLVSPEEVPVGALIEVLPGERIPLDGEVIEGSSAVDTSSLTGESIPRNVNPGDKVLAGFVNDGGRLLVCVEKGFGQTAVARILELVEEAESHKAPTEKFISRFAAIYTPVVVAIAAIIAIVPPIVMPSPSFVASLSKWVYRALVLLVISCPCALIVSIPLSYFGGIGSAARKKLLIKGANHIDTLAKVDTIVFDKTGTLTEGHFSVLEVVPRNGFSKEQLLIWAAAAESKSMHPIARSICAARSIDAGAISKEQEAEDIQELKGFGVIARVGGHEIIVGNDRFLHKEKIIHEDCDVDGTVAYVIVDRSYAGYLIIADAIKQGAAEAIASLKQLGLRKTAMLSGDSESVAKNVAKRLGIDEFYAELLPNQKVERLEKIREDRQKNGSIVFVGDGMNDAPVLIHADLGIAMGGLGSDAAIEAADVVVMDDDIRRIPLALRIAKFTRKIVLQNIVFALSVKGAFIILGSVGVANMWEAVIADVGVSLLAVMNSLRTIGHKFS
ncbi:MAG TPA: heavy metal translocating P-type ATPase [Rectinema sp.]|nr:heavy metal translocating P-type ATPase [Rectinema sp.]